jgi:hypothetical protein
VFWECGGTLAAPAISSGVIHKVLAFIAPKIIGGERAPTPVGELGNVEMTQAVTLLEPTWKQVCVSCNMLQWCICFSSAVLPHRFEWSGECSGAACDACSNVELQGRQRRCWSPLGSTGVSVI